MAKALASLSISPSPQHEPVVLTEGQTCSCGAASNWLGRQTWPDVVFAFHDKDEIGPKMLARIANTRASNRKTYRFFFRSLSDRAYPGEDRRIGKFKPIPGLPLPHPFRIIPLLVGSAASLSGGFSPTFSFGGSERPAVAGRYSERVTRPNPKINRPLP